MTCLLIGLFVERKTSNVYYEDLVVVFSTVEFLLISVGKNQYVKHFVLAQMMLL